MPKVDIIIPAYNAARYVALAIESVIAQTFDDWQIVLVDDGSKDNTAETVAPYIQSLGPKLRYLRQENRGVSAARNCAIQNSSSEFIAFLDADDIWLPDRLEQSLHRFENRPSLGLTYGLISWIDAEGHITGTYAGNSPKHAEGLIAPHIYTRMVELPCVTVTLRRKCLDDVGLFDETMHATEDRDLWLRIAQRYEIGFIPKVIALYRVSPGSATTDPTRMLNSQLHYIRKHYGSPGCGLRARQAALARVYKQRAEALKLCNRSREALLSSLRSVLLYPLHMGNFRTAGSLLLNWVRSPRRT